MRSLLDERNWFYLRFKEELELNNTDMKKLQQLMELEKSTNGLADLQQKKKVDARPPVGFGLARKNLDTKPEVDSVEVSKLSSSCGFCPSKRVMSWLAM